MKDRRARQLYEQGVIAIYIIGSDERAVMIGTFYGQTGGHDNEDAAQKTDGIIEILVDEMENHGGNPEMHYG